MVETVERPSVALAHWTTWVVVEGAMAGTGHSRASGAEAASTDSAARLERLLMALTFFFRPNGQTGTFRPDVAVRLSRE
jgi:hypothetical protein